VIWIWIGFIGMILAFLALDLGVFNRHAHVVSTKEAIGWSTLWISLSLLFSAFVYFGYQNHWMGMGQAVDAVDGLVNTGQTALLKYLTGYVVELSLSVDNVFVIAMIFGYFAVPPIYQHRVLFWGIVGAQVLRGLMIGVGAALVAQFHWVLYLFGAFLVFTAIKMLVMKTDETDPNNNPVVKFARRFLPVTARFHGEHFLVRAGSAAATEAAQPGQAAERDEVLEKAIARYPVPDPPGPGPDHRGDHGCGVCRGLHPGDLLDHGRSLPCVHQQHLRHSRAALLLLRPGQHAQRLPLPEGGPCRGAAGCRLQDAGRRVAEGYDGRALQPVSCWGPWWASWNRCDRLAAVQTGGARRPCLRTAR
jgi:TerC family integral membrane protein